MTKFYYDYQKINSQLMPELYEAQKKLNSVLYRVNSLNIPYAFYYRNYLLELTSRIQSYIDKLKIMENKITYTNNEMLKISDNFSYNISLIENSEISTRQSVVKQ